MAIEMRSRAGFRSFVDSSIAPIAATLDAEERLPDSLVRNLGQSGYLGAIVPEIYGGLGLDMLTFGALHEEIGRGCSSVRNLLTVHSMVCHAIMRWGSVEQRKSWLPRLAAGHSVAAFALSEPEVGSDAAHIQSSASRVGETYILNGWKKWITVGAIADLFLVFMQSDHGLCAFLVGRDAPGLTIRPLRGMLGARASMLAELRFDACRVPQSSLLGPPGLALGTVVTSALDIGRYSVASGCVGLAQACLDASIEYASQRRQGGALLREHQLIQAMITEMMVNVRAARLLCEQAGRSKDEGDPNTIVDTLVAKYFASTVSARAATDAVQIHGANGCSDNYPVERYYRDAKIMEIIEGSTQIQQGLIARHGFQTGVDGLKGACNGRKRAQ
jgi:alkylation response protein AidB-like acyl-CoA dehydrogenase